MTTLSSSLGTKETETRVSMPSINHPSDVFSSTIQTNSDSFAHLALANPRYFEPQHFEPQREIGELVGATDKPILIVDDHALLADCLAYALNSAGHAVKVVLPDDASQVLAAAEELGSPIVLLDLMLGPAGNGVDLIAPLRRLGCQVVVLTHVTRPEHLGAALAAGALGVLAKSASFEQTEGAVQRVLAGKSLHEPQQRHAFLAAHYAAKVAETQQARRWHSLTLREQQVLDLLAAGSNVSEIASSSFVSVSTVRSQVRAIFSKLGVHNQLAAVAAYRHFAKSA